MNGDLAVCWFCVLIVVSVVIGVLLGQHKMRSSIACNADQRAFRAALVEFDELRDVARHMIRKGFVSPRDVRMIDRMAEELRALRDNNESLSKIEGT